MTWDLQDGVLHAADAADGIADGIVRVAYMNPIAQAPLDADVSARQLLGRVLVPAERFRVITGFTLTQRLRPTVPTWNDWCALLAHGRHRQTHRRLVDVVVLPTRRLGRATAQTCRMILGKPDEPCRIYLHAMGRLWPVHAVSQHGRDWFAETDRPADNFDSWIDE